MALWPYRNRGILTSTLGLVVGRLDRIEEGVEFNHSPLIKSIKGDCEVAHCLEQVSKGLSLLQQKRN